MHQYMLETTHLENSLAEKAMGVLVDKLRVVARRSKEVILPFCLGHTWNAVSSSGLLGTGETWTCWRDYNKGP